MEKIKDTIQTVIHSLEGKYKYPDSDDPTQLLKKVLTKKELQHIKFNYFKKGVLGVSVDSSAWLYKLSLEKESLLSQMQKGSAFIKDIRFRIGEIK